MRATRFSHLHVASDHSLRFSTATVGDLVKRARDLRMPALALTDRDTLSGIPELLLRCGDEVTPVIGLNCGLRLEPAARHYRLVLLARNHDGYRNLLRLLHASYVASSSSPFITPEDLERFSDGLVALASGWDAAVANDVAHGDIGTARSNAKLLASALGDTRFFLALQNHDVTFPGGVTELDCCAALAGIAHDVGVDVVATNDVRYCDATDAPQRDALARHHFGNSIDTAYAVTLDQSAGFSLRSSDDMAAALKEFPAAFDKTAVLLHTFDKIKLERPLRVPVSEAVGAGETSTQALRRLATAGARATYGDELPPAVLSRLETELELFDERGLSDYVLLYRDVVNRLRERGIPVGPGRGASASVVFYVLGVTECDPLEHDLHFELWIQPGDRYNPRATLEVGHAHLSSAFDCLREAYGAERVAHILGPVPLGSLEALHKAAALTGASPAQTTALLEALQEAEGRVHIGHSIPSLRWARGLGSHPTGDIEYEHLLECARALERMIDGRSTGGDWWQPPEIAICAEPLVEEVPVHIHRGLPAVGYSGYDLDPFGVMTMPLSGLRILDVVAEALRLIDEHQGVPVHLADVPLDDAATLALFAAAETQGVYMFESSKLRELLERARPQSFSDLCAVLALSYPFATSDGLTENYLLRDSGTISPMHPEVDPIVQDTRGLFLYVEQLMQAWTGYGGFSTEQALRLKRATRFMRRDELDTIKLEWTIACARANRSEAESREVWRRTFRYSSAQFPKSQAVAQTLLAYRCGYLKVHWPREYGTAYRTVMGEDAVWWYDPIMWEEVPF